MKLRHYFLEYERGLLSQSDFLDYIDRCEELYDKSVFLLCLGSPVRSSRDYERARKRGLSGLQSAVLNLILFPNKVETIENKVEDLKLVEDVTIRPQWLYKFIERIFE